MTKEAKRMADCRKEAERIISLDTFKGEALSIRLALGVAQVKAFGYYTFLDPSTGLKTFVNADGI
jgi:hypothetical protein